MSGEAKPISRFGKFALIFRTETCNSKAQFIGFPQ